MIEAMADRARLTAELMMLVALAKRDQYIVKRFTADKETPWDKRHGEINARLTELVGA